LHTGHASLVFGGDRDRPFAGLGFATIALDTNLDLLGDHAVFAFTLVDEIPRTYDLLDFRRERSVGAELIVAMCRIALMDRGVVQPDVAKLAVSMLDPEEQAMLEAIR
jgi:hypothetical protein